MKCEFLRWKDPGRVNRDDYDLDRIEDQSLVDLLDACTTQPFEPAMAYSTGPFGFIPAAPQNSASELYDLWVMHTDGDLGPSVVRRIEEVPGVEVLHVWTRYRAWLGVGRCFNAEQVQNDIRKAVCRPPAGSRDPFSEL